MDFLWHREASLLVLVFFMGWISLWLPIAIPLAIWLKWRPFQPIALTQKLPLLASLYLLAPLVLWQLLSWQQQTFADLGLPWQRSLFSSFLLGLVIGSLGLLGLFGLEHRLGWLQWQGTQSTDRAALADPEGSNSPVCSDSSAPEQATVPKATPILLSTLLLSIWVAGTEELIFRGFMLTQFQPAENLTIGAAWVAAFVTSGIFALLHLVWEGRENIPQLPGLWLMGMVLVWARWVDSGNLGLAWGLHAGWIWAIASLETLTTIHYTGHAPEWLTGFGGKPLAGGIGITFLLLTGLLLAGIDFLAAPF